MEEQKIIPPEEIIKYIEEALQRVFGTNVKTGRFVDTDKFMFICKDIEIIKNSIVEMREMRKELVTQDQFWPVKTLVYGMVAIMFTSLVGSLMLLILK